MLKRPSGPLSTPTPALDPHSRNPYVQRQSGIPSLNRPRGLSGTGVPDETTHTPGTSASKPLTGYQYLSQDQISTPITSHSRRASMPQPLPSVSQAQIDIERDRIAKGLVSPPIVDFTRFDDRYRGSRTSGNFEGLVTKTKQTNRGSVVVIKPILKRNPQSSSGVMKSDMLLDPHPASMRKPDPRLIVSVLETVVPDSLRKPADVLDVHDLLGMHQLDQLDFEERDIARRNSGETCLKGVMVVLGEPLRKASIYASMAMVLGGREHELPIIVVSCIEELYRTGIYKSNLFRTLPNRSRLLELINIFDSEKQPPGSVIRSSTSKRLTSSPVTKLAGFGANMSLHLESTPDICALLSTYLSALPEPILLPSLFRPIWDWCGLEEEEEDDDGLKKSNVDVSPFRHHISSLAVPLARTYTNPTESTHILTAQLVLHLLPSPHFSLLIYVLAFFSQVAMVHEENGVGIEDLARMFGGRIFGGGRRRQRQRKISSAVMMGVDHHHETEESRMEGEIMMCWFLKRWGSISDNLFDVIEHAKTGVLQDGRRSIEKKMSTKKGRCYPPLGEGGDSLEQKGRFVLDHALGRDTPFRPPWKDDERSLSPSSDGGYFTKRSSISHPRPGDESTRRNAAGTTSSSNNDNIKERLGDVSDKHLDYDHFSIVPQVGRSLDNDTFNIPTMDDESIYSATALDERLLDISMPTLLLDQNDDHDEHGSRSIPPMNVEETVTKLGDNDDDEINRARRRIQVLETELEKSRRSVTESVQELSKERARCLDLEHRVRALEVQLGLEGKRIHEVETGNGDGITKAGEKLDLNEEESENKKERETALDLVREIRKLIVKN